MSIDHGKVLALNSDDRRHIERAIRLLRRDHESPLADSVERIYKHALAQPAEAVEGADDYVAFLRFDDHNGTRPTSVHLCDSDHPDAFKVYREPKRITPTDAAQGAVAPFAYGADLTPGDYDMEHSVWLLRPGESVPAGCTPLYTHPQAAPAQVPLIARAKAEWHEDDGAVMWWAWCGHEWAGEPAWCGTPNDSDWPGYHTHWTSHPKFPAAPTQEGE